MLLRAGCKVRVEGSRSLQQTQQAQATPVNENGHSTLPGRDWLGGEPEHICMKKWRGFCLC
jgi:hypothetical protein